MLGSSRESLAACSTALDALRQAPGFDVLAGQLFAVAAVLDDNPQLRSTLADSGQLSSVRQSLVRDILSGKVDDLTLDVVADAVERRWSDDVDLVVALEQLAAQAAFTVAEADGTLDATEEEIFRFGRAVDASAALQMALGDPAQTPATKAAIVRDLLQ
ncbi:MAG: F0F1 ATP synthase subunit delta, partial [Candidatus Nanopelagicales bacterium]